MIKILILLYKYIASFIYNIFKIKKTKNKLLLLSRQSTEIPLDFSLLKKEFEENNIKVKYISTKYNKGIINFIRYSFNFLLSLYHLADSKYCVIDGYLPQISTLKHKEDLKVLQIWHALGAIKKFGFQSLDKKEGRKQELANMLNMHKNYTYISSPSKNTSQIYEKAFATDKKQIKIIGMPRVDYLLKMKENKNEDKEIYKDYPYLKEKKTIVYVPTFRKKSKIKYEELINIVDKNEFNLIIRLHPLDKNIIPVENSISRKYNTYDLLNIADYIVTDYSAIMLEASILNKPLYLYVYDYNKYKKNRGLNIDLKKELKKAIVYNETELINKIKREEYDYMSLIRFKNKYVETLNFNNTKAIYNLLVKEIEETNDEKN